MRNVFLVHNPIPPTVSTTHEAQNLKICVFTYNSHLPFTTCDEFGAIK